MGFTYTENTSDLKWRIVRLWFRPLVKHRYRPKPSKQPTHASNAIACYHRHHSILHTFTYACYCYTTCPNVIYHWCWAREWEANPARSPAEKVAQIGSTSACINYTCTIAFAASHHQHANISINLDAIWSYGRSRNRHHRCCRRRHSASIRSATYCSITTLRP